MTTPYAFGSKEHRSAWDADKEKDGGAYLSQGREATWSNYADANYNAYGKSKTYGAPAVAPAQTTPTQTVGATTYQNQPLGGSSVQQPTSLNNVQAPTTTQQPVANALQWKNNMATVGNFQIGKDANGYSLMSWDAKNNYGRFNDQAGWDHLAKANQINGVGWDHITGTATAPAAATTQQQEALKPQMQAAPTNGQYKMADGGTFDMNAYMAGRPAGGGTLAPVQISPGVWQHSGYTGNGTQDNYKATAPTNPLYANNPTGNPVIAQQQHQAQQTAQTQAAGQTQQGGPGAGNMQVLDAALKSGDQIEYNRLVDFMVQSGQMDKGVADQMKQGSAAHFTQPTSLSQVQAPKPGGFSVAGGPNQGTMTPTAQAIGDGTKAMADLGGGIANAGQQWMDSMKQAMIAKFGEQATMAALDQAKANAGPTMGADGKYLTPIQGPTSPSASGYVTSGSSDAVTAAQGGTGAFDGSVGSYNRDPNLQPIQPLQPPVAGAYAPGVPNYAGNNPSGATGSVPPNVPPTSIQPGSIQPGSTQPGSGSQISTDPGMPRFPAAPPSVRPTTPDLSVGRFYGGAQTLPETQQSVLDVMKAYGGYQSNPYRDRENPYDQDNPALKARNEAAIGGGRAAMDQAAEQMRIQRVQSGAGNSGLNAEDRRNIEIEGSKSLSGILNNNFISDYDKNASWDTQNRGLAQGADQQHFNQLISSKASDRADYATGEQARQFNLNLAEEAQWRKELLKKEGTAGTVSGASQIASWIANTPGALEKILSTGKEGQAVLNAILGNQDPNAPTGGGNGSGIVGQTIGSLSAELLNFIPGIGPFLARIASPIAGYLGKQLDQGIVGMMNGGNQNPGNLTGYGRGLDPSLSAPLNGGKSPTDPLYPSAAQSVMGGGYNSGMDPSLSMPLNGGGNPLAPNTGAFPSFGTQSLNNVSAPLAVSTSGAQSADFTGWLKMVAETNGVPVDRAVQMIASGQIKVEA